MLYFILFELFLPLGAFIHRYQQDFVALILEDNKKISIGYHWDFVIKDLEEKENTL